MAEGNYILNKSTMKPEMEKRQASAEIEITPKMLNAGTLAQFDFILDETKPEILARAIYVAMEQERRRSRG